MASTRYALSAVVSAVAVAVAVMLPASPAAGAAIVVHRGEVACFFEPGDVPGVDVYFEAECTFVTSDSGVTTIVGRAQLPEGFTLSETFVGTLPCFGGTGEVRATVSGEVTAICHFKP